MSGTPVTRRRLRSVAGKVAAATLASSLVTFGLGSPGPAGAAPGATTTPRVTVTDLGTSVHDLVMADGSIWATLPDQHRVTELDAATLDEQRRVLVGSGPRGIDLLDDGKLAIALNGATGYVELDPATEALQTVTLPLLGAPDTWDVANIGDGEVLVSANPGSGGLAYIVRVDRAAAHASTRVASNRIIRAEPTFATAGTTVLVGEGFSPNSLYRLDTTDPAMPIVAEDSHGDVSGTRRIGLSADGARAYLESGQVVRTSDMLPIGDLGPDGYPVVPASGSTVYSLTSSSVTAHETTTYSATHTYDISGCGFTDHPSAAIAPSATTLIASSGTRICRVDLALAPTAPTTPIVRPTPGPKVWKPTVAVTDVGSPVHDLVVSGDSAWATLPGLNRVAELDAATLAERRRVLVGTSPRGLDVLDDGKLAIALSGATGYVELDPASEALTTVTLPLLGAAQTWDVANVGDDEVLVSANPGSGGFAYIVRVDRAAAHASTRVASDRIIRAGPRFAAAGDTVLVGEGFSPNSLYRLDPSTSAMPIVAEDNHGDLSGTQRLGLDADGARAYLGSGQVVRTSDILPIGTIGAGYPVAATSGSTVHSVTPSSITAYETTTYSPTDTFAIAGCGFTSDISAAIAPDASTLILAAGSRICRVDLDVPFAPFESWEAFVTRQHLDLTTKAPTSSQLATWVKDLSSGAKTKGDLDDALRRGSENLANVDPVVRIYRAFLGRAPDATGLRFWIGRKRNVAPARTWSVSQISVEFTKSPEFQRKYGSMTNRRWVTQIYTDVLGRAADPSGVDYWTRQLDLGRKTRAQVMVGFSESNEHRTKQAQNTDVVVAYTFLLGRAPTASEASSWTTRQKAGTTHQTLLAELLDSPAYATRIAG